MRRGPTAGGKLSRNRGSCLLLLPSLVTFGADNIISMEKVFLENSDDYTRGPRVTVPSRTACEIGFLVLEFCFSRDLGTKLLPSPDSFIFKILFNMNSNIESAVWGLALINIP